MASNQKDRFYWGRRISKGDILKKVQLFLKFHLSLFFQGKKDN